MQKSELVAAIRGAILGLTKLENVVQAMNDDIIHELNSPTTAGTPVLPTATAGVMTPVVTESPVLPTATTEVKTFDLDDEGTAWDARIHTDTKTQIASKLVKGGKAWRLKKKLDDAFVEQVKAENKALTGTVETPVTPAVSAPTGLPGLPSTPAAVNTPPVAAGLPTPSGLPGLPASKPVDEYADQRKACIVHIKLLTDKFGLSWDDCKEIMIKEFDAAQPGEQVTFGSLRGDRYAEALEYFSELVEEYEKVVKCIADIHTLMGAEHKDYCEDGIKKLFEKFHTQVIDGVHYSDVTECLADFSGWLDTLTKWKAGQ